MLFVLKFAPITLLPLKKDKKDKMVKSKNLEIVIAFFVKIM